MRIVSFILALFLIQQVHAQSTDIWLFEIDNSEGKPVLKNGKNITKRKGYDNQPCFAKDSRSIYFSSGRDSSGQTDIYQYLIGDKKTRQITFTPKTSEFSPAIMHNENMSMLVVEEDKSQHIWEFPLKPNKISKRLFAKRDSIGYYALLPNDAVIAFILGNKESPHRLSIITEKGWQNTIDTNVGRTFVIQPALIFTRPTQDSGYMLYQSELIGWPQKPRPLTKAPGRSQDFAIFKDLVLMGNGSELYAARFGLEKRYVDKIEPFQLVTDLSAFGLKRISRLAISPDKKWIAIVSADE